MPWQPHTHTHTHTHKSLGKKIIKIAARQEKDKRKSDAKEEIKLPLFAGNLSNEKEKVKLPSFAGNGFSL